VLETVATLAPNQNQNLDVLMPIVQSRLSRLSGCFCIFIDRDKARYNFLKLLAQSGIPIKAIFLCEPHKIQESFVDEFSPRCRAHLVSIDNMQQDLLLI
jgi:hypothetical protein